MIKKELNITEEYLRNNPTSIFVFGDNTLRVGKGGAAKFRDHHNTLGFITKKFPNNDTNSFYTVEEYTDIFYFELSILIGHIVMNPNSTYLISRLGGGLANKYHIWENIIKPNLEEKLKEYNNVILLWEE